MIRIVAAEAIRVPFRLLQPYRIAGHTIAGTVNIILKVVTGDGRTGFGCAAPAESVTGESPESALLVLNDSLIPLLRESDARDPAAIERRAAAVAPAHPGARAALDIALHDLQAQRAGVPLAGLLGRRRWRLPTSITLGIADDLEATVARAREHVASGYRILKVKIGEDCEADTSLLHALRRAVGPDILLRADANQGYSEEEAARFLSDTATIDLELLEQPTPASDMEALLRLGRRSPVPIMADESLLTMADAEAFAAAGGPPLVNIKLMKSGGIVPAGRIAARIAQAGIGAMLGCNDESRIGIAAALHFALAAPNVERADLDGHLDLDHDVARGGVEIRDGYLWISEDATGLGVSVDL
jgi:L-alanine-DL-glutamate epimerase-like enolase superfamily enzyme